MKRIFFLFSLLFFVTVVMGAPWQGRFFFDEKTGCIYGIEVNDLGQNLTRRVCGNGENKPTITKGKSNGHHSAS
jgi:hypothetical protein